MLHYDKTKFEQYKTMLRNTAALSKLYSESEIPYLVSRSTENIYCDAFEAENLSRSDCTADAKYVNTGIGIKTFIHGNGRTLQKIAEFNKDSEEYRSLSSKELVIKISEMRNERIRFTKATHNISHMIYHCITRSPSKLYIYEEPMELINIKGIKNIVTKSTTITFEDGIHEYSFNITKSTLYKRFDFTEKCPLSEVDVKILDNPHLLLNSLTQQFIDSTTSETTSEEVISIEDLQYVILPLFSDRGVRHVPERSGLNQWNANGRPRDPNEIYVPIPAWIHTELPNFFPDRDSPFTLALPDHRELSSKVCQQGRKALMSNPNKALGEWLLREIFNLGEYELLTLEHLESAGIDSVRVTKITPDRYSIDFCEIGSYDLFKLNYSE